MKIYSDYDEEPELHFLPLPEELYRELYDLEMSDFKPDFSFYSTALQHNSAVLELGCGSGRLTRLLGSSGHRVVGIDISLPMLQAARNTIRKNVRYICMDMRTIALQQKFDAVIIPYNSLNLLKDNGDVHACLQSCREHLTTDGLLLMQLYIPSDEIRSKPGQTTFQFQMFDHPQGGKVIKEILRKYHQESHRLEMTERYKIRPMGNNAENANYSHTMFLNANDQPTWLNTIHSAGFTIQSIATRYDDTIAPSPSLLLIKATRQD